MRFLDASTIPDARTIPITSRANRERASMPWRRAALPKVAGRLQLDYIDGVRALAALYIVVHHVLMVTGPDKRGLAVLPFSFGAEMVAMFITISGFCLALPHAMRSDWKVDTRRFYVRRARRILPPYYAAVLLSILGMALRTQWGFTFPTLAVFQHLLLVQNWCPANMFQVNGPMWSVALECQIYLLFPMLILCRRKLGMLPMVGGATLLSYASFHLLHGVGQTQYLAFFVQGLFFAEAAFQPGSRRWLPSVIALACGGMVAGELYRPHIAQGFCAIFIGALLAYLMGQRHHPVRRLLSSRPLCFVGVFSYSIYLVHGIFMEPMWGYMHWKDPSFGLRNDVRHLSITGATALISIVFAYLFHRAVEQPFMGFPRKATESRLAVAVVA